MAAFSCGKEVEREGRREEGRQAEGGIQGHNTVEREGRREEGRQAEGRIQGHNTVEREGRREEGRQAEGVTTQFLISTQL